MAGIVPAVYANGGWCPRPVATSLDCLPYGITINIFGTEFASDPTGRPFVFLWLHDAEHFLLFIHKCQVVKLGCHDEI